MEVVKQILLGAEEKNIFQCKREDQDYLVRFYAIMVPNQLGGGI